MDKISNSIRGDHLENPGDRLFFVVSNEKNSQYLSNIHDYYFMDIDYELNQDQIKEKGFFGKEFYAIASDFNSANKQSKGYLDCIGILLAGKGELGVVISSLVHVPIYGINGFYGGLLEDDEGRKIIDSIINNVLDVFVSKTKKGTRDIVLFGGTHEGDMSDPTLKEMNLNYENSMEYFSGTIQNKTGFSPVIIGPNDINLDTDIYFVNDDRTLYIDKPLQRDRNEGFFPTNRPYTIDKVKEVTELWHSEDKEFDIKKKLFDVIS